jgi:glycosyltransferase involved in cell wall biosynthesis
MTERSAGRPRLSVGLAVYNGEAFLEETMRSFLDQTFTDFELIVSDNASTDGTLEIIRRLEAEDPRVRSHVFASNQGPAANYNKTIELTEGTDYFVWSAADDVREPTFLAKCVELLDRDPQASVGYSRTMIIEEGQPPKAYEYEPDVDAPTAHERLRTLLLVDHRRHGAFEIFGVMRLQPLLESFPLGAYARADSVYLVRMALRGRFLRVPEYLFLNRNHPDRSVRSVPARSYKGSGVVVKRIGSGPIPPDEWWDAEKRGRIVWPEWNLAREYISAVTKAPLSRTERLRCRLVVADYLVRHIPKLGRDVVINAEFQLRKLTDRRRRRTPVSA